VQEAIDICRAAGFDFILLESAGVGQSDASILDYCDVSLYVMTPEYGAASQLEKINMLDYADVVAINKFDKAGALDALARCAQAVQTQPPAVDSKGRRVARSRHYRSAVQRSRVSMSFLKSWLSAVEKKRENIWRK
jgi:putative protein kinase ArgK-like GTPase of G3E family